MQTFEIEGNNNISRLMVGERLSNLETYLPETRIVIITDTVVSRTNWQFVPQDAMTGNSGN